MRPDRTRIAQRMAQHSMHGRAGCAGPDAKVHSDVMQRIALCFRATSRCTALQDAAHRLSLGGRHGVLHRLEARVEEAERVDSVPILSPKRVRHAAAHGVQR